MLANNRKKIINMAERYRLGVQQLDKASEEVKELRLKLEMKEIQVNAEYAEVEALLEEIRQKSQVTSKA